jgi:hypothetical protein
MNKLLRIQLNSKVLMALTLGIVNMIPAITKAQTPSDAIMMEGKRICVAGLYGSDKWDRYWEGTLLRTNGNVTPFTRNTYGLMLAGGITTKLNILVSVPYVHTSSSGGYFKDAKGLQDFGAWLKAEVLKSHLGSGDFTTHAVVGFTTPMSNYLSDYAPFSLGLGAPEAQGRLILQYLLDMGIYARVTGAFLARGTTKIERDYYYADTGYYSDKVDVPNATDFTGTLGCWFFDRKLKVESTYENFNTVKGHDIRRQDAGFPSNKMEASSIGLHAQYFPAGGFGVLANYSQVFAGRNVGKSSGFLVGVTYQFGISKS